jgi:hypothetical protein
MKLHQNQLDLILHLIHMTIMRYEDCLRMLDTENAGDMIAMSYVFRPLTKNCYLAKNKDGIVTVLKKGRELFPDEGPLISTATRGKARDRVLQVSKVCMWMEQNDVPISGELLDTEDPYFIPSACWRNIGKGILSTTRFMGMLLAYDKKYAVYDIGDGTMEWQVKAEASLFFYKYGSFETKADGMIMICDEGRRNEIARRIIRQTMWDRKRLLKDHYTETDKPVRYSRSPIKLRTQYEHVYLTTPSLLSISLERIYNEDYYIENGVEGATPIGDPKQGDVEIYPHRYYLNPAFDILKLVYFFSTVKNDVEVAEKFPVPEVQRTMVVYPDELEVARMYPDVNEAKRVEIRVYRPVQNSGKD